MDEDKKNISEEIEEIFRLFELRAENFSIEKLQEFINLKLSMC